MVAKAKQLEMNRHNLTPQGSRSKEEKKLDKILEYGMKENPILPKVKEFCDAARQK